jgi:hypothetical protein
MHKAAQGAVVFGLHDQMKMIGHQTKTKDQHRNFDRGMAERLEKGLVVPVFVKDLLPIVAAIDHVIANAANRRSCGAWHESGAGPVSKS